MIRLVGTARCCRDWPVVVGEPMRRCGICGERPTMTDAPYEEVAL